MTASRPARFSLFELQVTSHMRCNMRPGETIRPEGRTTPEFWEKSYVASGFVGRPTSAFQEFFDRFLPKNPNWTALEIGACPGNNLGALALSHGYQPVALDFLPVVQGLVEAFRQQGIEGLRVIEKDFWTWQTIEQFNVVISLGFIEHFEDPALCLRRHWGLVAPGGMLFVGLPIFGSLQYLLRKFILTRDKFEESMNAHNRKVMNMNRLGAAMVAFPDAEIVFCDYIGHMTHWFSSDLPYVRPCGRHVLKVWEVLARIPSMLNWSSRWFSPYGLLVVQKTAKPLE